jgi:anaphase-promoting complex subunit 6
LLKAKILEAMDKRSLAIECYIQALQKSVYLTEALDSLLQHEVLTSWEEKDLLSSTLPSKQQNNEVDMKVLKYLYEQKLKKYYAVSSNVAHPEKTPNNTKLLNAINEKIKASENFDLRKSIGLSTSTAIKGSSVMRTLGTPLQQQQQIPMSPANKILYDLKNTSALSIHASISRNSMLNNSCTINSIKTTFNTVKNACDALDCEKALQLLNNSVDIMVARAEEFFYNCEYKRSLKIVDEILERDPYHKRTLFIKIGCLMELKDSNGKNSNLKLK